MRKIWRSFISVVIVIGVFADNVINQQKSDHYNGGLGKNTPQTYGKSNLVIPVFQLWTSLD